MYGNIGDIFQPKSDLVTTIGQYVEFRRNVIPNFGKSYCEKQTIRVCDLGAKVITKDMINSCVAGLQYELIKQIHIGGGKNGFRLFYIVL